MSVFHKIRRENQKKFVEFLMSDTFPWHGCSAEPRCVLQLLVLRQSAAETALIISGGHSRNSERSVCEDGSGSISRDSGIHVDRIAGGRGDHRPAYCHPSAVA